MKQILKITLTLSLLSQILIAAPKQGKSSKSSSKSSSESSLESGEKKVEYKKNTKVDFDESTITGERKNPFATMLNSRDQEFNKGFINIRKNWHDKMIMSVQGLAQ
jgi:hypothetical protein